MQIAAFIGLSVLFTPLVATAAEPTKTQVDALLSAAGCPSYTRAETRDEPLERYALDGSVLYGAICMRAAYNSSTVFFTMSDEGDGFTLLSFPTARLRADKRSVAFSSTIALPGGSFDAASQTFGSYHKGVGWGGCGESADYAWRNGAPALTAQWSWDFCEDASGYDAYSQALENGQDQFMIYPKVGAAAR